MIYFVQQGKDGPIKIGLVTRGSVIDRLAELQCGNPNQLCLLGTMDGDRTIESQIHRRFVGAHIRGEWFRPVETLLVFIHTLSPMERFEYVKPPPGLPKPILATTPVPISAEPVVPTTFLSKPFLPPRAVALRIVPYDPDPSTKEKRRIVDLAARCAAFRRNDFRDLD